MIRRRIRSEDHNVRSLKQLVTTDTDFEKLHDLYGGCAYTAMKFFLANQGLGEDYHFNFVTETHSFKNMSLRAYVANFL